MHAKTLAIISPSLVPTALHSAHRLTYYRAGFAKSQHARPMTQGLSLRVIHPRKPGAMLDCKGQHASPPLPTRYLHQANAFASQIDASLKKLLPTNLPMRSSLT
ncbi:hypothetical protein PS664_01968 [Pseudomonas fluorescens]|nr:hypothetical protein PS664_01968 [Pseudomonas fluorescens]